MLSIQEAANASAEYRFGRAVGLYVDGDGFDSTMSMELKKLQWLAALDLEFTSLTDSDFKVFQDLPQLRTLWLGTKEISIKE